jgi:hypothetical protein
MTPAKYYFLKQGRAISCFLEGYPLIYAKTKPRDHDKVIKTDPIWGEKGRGIHENMSKKQELVFIKDPEAKLNNIPYTNL